LAERRQLIRAGQAMAFPEAGDPRRLAPTGGEGFGSEVDADREATFAGSTTSFSIRDRWGNVVACTPTHGSGFGTGVVVGNTGMTFNNGTRHGSTSPYPDDVNYARGGQVPILNNSPTLVLKDGAFHAAVGTPGGETIGQTEFQVLVNLLDYGMDIQEAIEAPRFVLDADPNFYRAGASVTMSIEARVPDAAVEGLRRRGWRVELAPGYSFGSMQGILIDPRTGNAFAGADPRRVAYAIGW
ncbi:MAG: gamma-glutamyltransferase family protein, partial [Gemmatimonadetes bacterium]|nr:gamma-glutamyltransferase family protein [Gemmatimonadota bacterium]NIR80162.1 gamma-glutamyltransferase family protein [Gemmatimonadota bacterium]NIT88919.1 gamma-glutamyltransferase family protein [Gemmatimonadota bacterium]NIU32718.1 gamma-glutamyltransferase family protein [Gemmatimonadota bacterium]NIU37153.1 gamma-glutamyltransferase family protein [Gemmatimonadota bacterium]